MATVTDTGFRKCESFCEYLRDCLLPLKKGCDFGSWLVNSDGDISWSEGVLPF